MNASSRILITAGPTHEPIDAVRYIANRSSGRMGTALAEHAAGRGHPTTLLLGPTQMEPQPLSHLTLLRFRTTDDLQNLIRAHWPQHDMLIMAAAVADYRPGPPSTGSAAALPTAQKISRTSESLTLHLEPTPDLLAQAASTKRAEQIVVGFALEPADQLLASAKRKLMRKGLDAIIANPLETMDAETIPAGATVIFKDGRELAAPPALTKHDFATWLLDALDCVSPHHHEP